MRISKTSLFVLVCTLTLAIALLLPPKYLPFLGSDEREISSGENTPDDSIVSTGNENAEVNNLPDLTVHDIQIYCEKGRIIKNMNNKVSMIVSNDGNTCARNVKVALYIKYRDGDNLVYISNEVIAYLGRGEEKRVEITLFSPKLKDAAVALLKFAGIEQIVVKVDPYNKIEESNEENNVVYEYVSYGDIFPRFSKFEGRIINLVEEKGYDDSFVKQVIMKFLENSDENNITSIESLFS